MRGFSSTMSDNKSSAQLDDENKNANESQVKNSKLHYANTMNNCANEENFNKKLYDDVDLKKLIGQNMTAECNDYRNCLLNNGAVARNVTENGKQLTNVPSHLNDNRMYTIGQQCIMPIFNKYAGDPRDVANRRTATTPSTTFFIRDTTDNCSHDPLFNTKVYIIDPTDRSKDKSMEELIGKNKISYVCNKYKQCMVDRGAVIRNTVNNGKTYENVPSHIYKDRMDNIISDCMDILFDEAYYMPYKNGLIPDHSYKNIKPRKTSVN